MSYFPLAGLDFQISRSLFALELMSCKVKECSFVSVWLSVVVHVSMCLCVCQCFGVTHVSMYLSMCLCVGVKPQSLPIAALSHVFVMLEFQGDSRLMFIMIRM